MHPAGSAHAHESPFYRRSVRTGSLGSGWVYLGSEVSRGEMVSSNELMFSSEASMLGKEKLWSGRGD